MKKIKYILSLFLLTISSIVYSQSTSPYYVRVLHVLNGESVMDSYILPSELDSITFTKINFYNVSATLVSEDMGSVILSKNLVREGESVTMTASENIPYQFKNWILNGVVVSEDNPYTAIITDNSEFIANYEYDQTAGRNSVDLGLSVKWATCNLGANSPEQEGDHFMWGETFPRTYFGNMVDDINTYTDNPQVLPLSADAANDIWKGDWRMPTKEECEELIANCKWELTTLYGVELLSVTSKINGNRIYMPIPGCGIQGSEIYYPGDSGWYLTSTNDLDSPGNSYALFVAKSVYSITMAGDADKNWAFVIRPVLPYLYYNINAVSIDDTLGSVQQSSQSVREKESITIEATPSAGYRFINWTIDGVVVSVANPYTFIPTSDIEIVANYESLPSHTVTARSSNNEQGTVSPLSQTIKENTQATLTAIPGKSYKFKNWTVNGVVVSTENPYTPVITQNTEFVANFEYDPYAGMEYVDLGLSVKWATYNLGASMPEQPGDYFMWGETSPRTSVSSQDYAYNENPSVLPLSVDAINATWGGDWRMPTKEECTELCNNCTWKTGTINGVTVVIGTSKKNGNTITFPVPGYMTPNNPSYDAGKRAFYWTATKHSTANYACRMQIHTTTSLCSAGAGVYRYYGCLIRGVIE